MNDLIPITVQVRRVLPTDGHDDVAAKLMALEALGQLYKEIKAEVEREAQLWIKDNGPVTAGKMLYWLGKTKKPPKCVDPVGTFTTLLEVSQGDMQQVADCLSANPFKYGSIKRMVTAERFGELFKQEEVEELKTKEIKDDGRTLQKADVRYLER